MDQLTCCSCGALRLWAGGPRFSPFGYQRCPWRTLLDCGRCGGGRPWGDSHQFQRREAAHAPPRQLLGWPAGSHLCSIQYVTLGGRIWVELANLARTSDGRWKWNEVEWNKKEAGGPLLVSGVKLAQCSCLPPFSHGLTASWTDQKAKDGSHFRTLVLLGLSFMDKESWPVWWNNGLITKAFIVVLTFSSVVYICTFSNTVLGFSEGQVYWNQSVRTRSCES